MLPLLLAAELTLSLQEPAATSTSPTTAHVRGANKAVRGAIQEGCGRSPTFAALVSGIEQSNFIVYVDAVTDLRNGMKAALLHGAGPHYLRINIRRDLSRHMAIVVIAHELQHVREVIDAGINGDPVEMEFLYRRIGVQRLMNGRRQQFETTQARRVEETVASELLKKLPANEHACVTAR